MCAACLHVILSPWWQVRESNVMRLSPLWFKHEHGKEGETERGSQFSFSKRRPSLQLCNSLPHFYCKEDPSDKKKKKDAFFASLHGFILQTFVWLVLECIRHEKHHKNNISECILQGCCQDVWAVVKAIERLRVTLMITPYGTCVTVSCVLSSTPSSECVLLSY